MPSPLAECSELVATLREALQRGDWSVVQEMAAALASSETPADRGEIAVHLDQLELTLILARSARNHAAARLGRVRAASIFNASGSETRRDRHNFGDPPES